MVRDLRRLADTRFDVLVVGAGIYGAAAAWDAAQRGLQVALIDRGDFGGGTSFNSLKTLHGGLRSLQALNVRQMRLFIRERRALARIAPHLVRPLPFVIATSRHPTRNRLALRVALAVNDAVAIDRNDGLADPALHLPSGRIVSRAEALRLNPFIPEAGVTGGAVWFDYQMTSADRVLLAFVQSATAAGAVAANYVGATTLVRDGGRVAGIRVEDRRSGDAFDIRATVVVNATGAWAPTLFPDAHGAPARRLSRAMNLVLSSVPGTHACGGVADGRTLLLVPWRGVTLLGTSHDVHVGSADALTVARSDVEAFLSDGRKAFPQARLHLDDVRLVHRGLLPMVSGVGSDVRLLKESVVVDHATVGSPGLISIHGVRYTTARQTAQDAVDRAFRVLGYATPPASRSADTPLQGGDITSVDAFVRAAGSSAGRRVPAEAVERVARTYGTGYNAVLRHVQDDAALGERLSADCPILGAEILHAARHEMAMTLGDAVIRRTDVGSAGHPDAQALERAAAIMAAAHGWDAERTAQELADVEAFYLVG